MCLTQAGRRGGKNTSYFLKKIGVLSLRTKATTVILIEALTESKGKSSLKVTLER